MQFKNKASILIATFLILTMVIPAFMVDPTAAQTSGQMSSYAYLIVEPNPVGVGQTTYIAMIVDVPLPGASEANDIRRHNYQLTITAPDGTTKQKLGIELQTQQAPNQHHSHQPSRNLHIRLQLPRPKLHMDNSPRRKRSLLWRSIPRHHCNSNPNSPTRPSSCNSRLTTSN